MLINMMILIMLIISGLTLRIGIEIFKQKEAQYKIKTFILIYVSFVIFLISPLFY